MFQAETALMYDSVQVFVHGLAALDRSHDLRLVNLSCEKEEPWDDGLSLYNYINAVRTFCESLSRWVEYSDTKYELIVQVLYSASDKYFSFYFSNL